MSNKFLSSTFVLVDELDSFEQWAEGEDCAVVSLSKVRHVSSMVGTCTRNECVPDELQLSSLLDFSPLTLFSGVVCTPGKHEFK